VTDQQRRLGTAFLDEAADVGGQRAGVVGGDAIGLRGQVVAAQVGGDDPESRRRERFELQPPTEPELGEAVQRHDQRPLAGLDVMQPDVADLGIALTKLAALKTWHLQFRHPTGAAGAVLTRTHSASLGVVSALA